MAIPMNFWHLTVTVVIVIVLLDHSNALGFVLCQFEVYVNS